MGFGKHLPETALVWNNRASRRWCGPPMQLEHEALRAEMRRSLFCLLPPGETASSRRLTEVPLRPDSSAQNSPALCTKHSAHSTVRAVDC